MLERPHAAGHGSLAYTTLLPVVATAATAVVALAGVLALAVLWGDPATARRLVPVVAGVAVVLAGVAAVLGRRLWLTVADLRSSAEEARRIAFRDPVTGLANEAALRRVLDGGLARIGDGRGMALVALTVEPADPDDVDAHAVQRTLSERLTGAVRGSDTVARTATGFSVVLADTSRRTDVRTVCDRILAGVRGDLPVGDRTVRVDVHLGIALAPDHASRADDLSRRAGLALDEARAAGPGSARLFEERFDEPTRRRAALLADLDRSVARGGEIGVLFQPIVGPDRESLAGMEALARWNHPDDGPRPPAEFLPLAEESGLILPIGETVLRQALRTAAPLDRLSLAVNLSPAQLARPDLAVHVGTLVEAAGFDPARLELEVTESTLAGADRRTLAVLSGFRERGIRIVLDDFGSGGASLGLLRTAPVDRVKIDPSLVRGAATDPAARAVARALVTAAHGLGLTATAEGVETEAQLAAIAEAGCDLFQGFLFSPPVPAGVMAAYAAGEPLPLGRRRMRLASGAA
jgi:predicted signal transduction protein with EAL and GGDEF domain